MPMHTAMVIGFLIFLAYTAQRFIHKKFLSTVVTGLCIFAAFGAVTHPGDVIVWATDTVEKMWPIVMQSARRGSDSFVRIMGTISTLGGGK